MPELPEVETVRRGLEPAMTGRKITTLELRREGLRFPFPKDFARLVSGASVERLRRRSKYLLIDLSNAQTLLVHLGMSGRMTVSKGAEKDNSLGIFVHPHQEVQKHDHVIFHLSEDFRVTYNDPRRFGFMDLFPTQDETTHKALAGLGPEPLGNQFEADYLKAALKGKKSSIKSALLDQRVVSGLGNIYVCEALWRSHITPLALAGNIKAAKLDLLVQNIRHVLAEAIEAGGSSLKDHRQASGELGYFQHNFAVYGREDAPCRTEACTGKIKRIVQSGRSSFYCAKCQKK